MEIRDSRLYRESHGTFEEYCKSKWGLKQSRAYQMIDAAKVSTNLKSSTNVELPQKESQARPLTKLPADQQAPAWEKAVEIAGGEQPTAKQVEEAVNTTSRMLAQRLTKCKIPYMGDSHSSGTPCNIELSDAKLDTALQILLSSINNTFALYFWKSFLEKKVDFHPMESMALHNGLLHSSMLHLRSLHDFCNGGRFPTDLKPSNFPGLIGLTGFLDEPEKSAIDKHIAHLSHLTVEKMNHHFNYGGALRAAIPKFRIICEYATMSPAVNESRKRLAQDTLNVMKFISCRYIDTL